METTIGWTGKSSTLAHPKKIPVWISSGSKSTTSSGKLAVGIPKSLLPRPNPRITSPEAKNGKWASILEGGRGGGFGGRKVVEQEREIRQRTESETNLGLKFDRWKAVEEKAESGANIRSRDAVAVVVIFIKKLKGVILQSHGTLPFFSAQLIIGKCKRLEACCEMLSECIKAYALIYRSQLNWWNNNWL